MTRQGSRFEPSASRVRWQKCQSRSQFLWKEHVGTCNDTQEHSTGDWPSL